MIVSRLLLFFFLFSNAVVAQQGIYCDSISANDSIVKLNLNHDSLLFDYDYSANNHSVSGGVYVIQHITLDDYSIIDSTSIRNLNKQAKLTSYVYPSQTTVVDLFFTNQSIPTNYTVNATYHIESQDTCKIPFVITYNSALGFETSRLKEKEFSVFPNPFHEQLNIKTKELNYDIEVFNILGELVYAQQNMPSKIVDLGKLKKGTYFLKVTFNKGSVQAYKLIKG